jgi:hypothetical protein
MVILKMYKGKECKLLGLKRSICPLKPDIWLDCKYDFECNIRREIKRVKAIINEVEENAIL